MKNTTFILLICIYSIKLIAQPSISFTHPTTCNGNEGKIIIHGVTPKVIYSIGYEKNGSNENYTDTADSSGLITIGYLSIGTYKKFTIKKKYVKETGTNEGKIEDSVTLKDGCIAQQKFSFMAAAFQKFTGIQDDNPENFTQVFAYVSQPLNKGQGIKGDSKKRFIWFRNAMFQITYGETEKFKMYAYDTLNTKYVNKLDLFAHAHLNANATLNILTYILGENWKAHSGDMAHIYLDAFTSLLITNVTDTTARNIGSSKKTYNVKSNIYGLAISGIFKNAFESKFSIKGGWKLFWIFPYSSSVSGNLNPQNNNIHDLHLQQNSTKNFSLDKRFPYYTFDVLMKYMTSKKEEDNSNIFLHYAYTSNFASKKSTNFYNNYFQFQLGYSMDITKIFKSKKDSSEDSKDKESSN